MYLDAALSIWWRNPENLYDRPGGYWLWYGDFSIDNGDLFLMRSDGFIPRSTSRNGSVCCADDFIHYRYRWNKNCMDFWDFPIPSFFENSVCFLSGILDADYFDAGGLLLFCKKESASGIKTADSI